MRYKQKLLAILVSALMLVQLFPSVAVARKWTPQPGEAPTSDGFIRSVHSEQFTVGVDSNRYTHSSASFGRRYDLSTEYFNQLLSLGSYSTQCELINFAKESWGGSCYGIAGTMVLSRLTKYNMLSPDKGLHISSFQPQAQDYFDLGVPRENTALLDMINYYMLSQILSVVGDMTQYVMLDPGRIDPAEVQQFVSFAKACADNGKPYLFGFFTTAGGHAIVGMDYYEEGNDLILKFYDENDRRKDQPLQDVTFSYMHLVKENGVYTTPYRDNNGDRVFNLFEYYDHDKPAALSAIMYVDFGEVNEYINIHGPVTPFVDATEARLQIHDIANTYGRYSVKPFTALGDPPAYIPDYAVFRQPRSNYLPCPVDVTMPDYFFKHMESMRYIRTTADPDGRTDLEMLLSEADQNTAKSFAGYDVVISDGAVCGFSMSKVTDPATGAGNYAAIQGERVNIVRFDANGKLRAVTASDGALSVYYGVRGADGNYDMFQLGLPKFSYLETYGVADHPSYQNSVVLHCDGFHNGLDFQFFNGALESEFISGITDVGDTWLKIQSKIVGGVVEVSVWSATETAGGEFPLFEGAPDWSTFIDTPLSVGGSAGHIDSPNQYRLMGHEGGLTYSGGDLRFTVDAPFAKYVSVSVDGVMVERGFVTVEEGSTVVTVAGAFMSTLKEGDHRLRVQFTDGSLQTTLTVIKNAPVPEVPATNGGALWPGVLLWSMSVAHITLYKRKETPDKTNGKRELGE